jgi:hypothetical protein
MVSDADLMDWDAIQRHRMVVHDDTMSDDTRERSRDALIRLFNGGKLPTEGVTGE